MQGVAEWERNLANKIARGSFTALFFVQWLEATYCKAARAILRWVGTRRISRNHQPERNKHFSETEYYKYIGENRFDDAIMQIATLNRHVEAFINQHKVHHTENAADGQESLALTQNGLRWSKIAVRLSFLAAMGTVGSAVFAELQFSEMRDEQRPWIQITKVVPQSVETDPDVFQVTYTIFYKNIGHSPATHIRFSNATLGYVATNHTTKELDKMCLSSSNYSDSLDALLPDEVGSYALQPTFDSKDIAHKTFEAVRDIDLSKYIDPSISGCVAYAFGSKDHLRTGYSFHLSRAKGHEFIINTVKTTVFNITVPEIVSEGGLVATMRPESKYAY